MNVYYLLFPCSSDGKASACSEGNLGSIPGLGRSLGWEHPLEKELATYSSILAWKNPTDGGAWWATVNGVAKSWTE